MIYVNDERGKPTTKNTLYLARLSFRSDGEIRSFPNKQKLRKSSTAKAALQQMLRELL